MVLKSSAMPEMKNVSSQGSEDEAENSSFMPRLDKKVIQNNYESFASTKRMED
jgi:hypothetical protein